MGLKLLILQDIFSASEMARVRKSLVTTVESEVKHHVNSEKRENYEEHFAQRVMSVFIIYLNNSFYFEK